jgi:hypothetical protein
VAVSTIERDNAGGGPGFSVIEPTLMFRFMNGNATGMVILVNVTESPNNQAWHTFMCQSEQQDHSALNIKIDGLPAHFQEIIHDGRDYYSFLTSRASYQISYRQTLLTHSNGPVSQSEQ